MEVFFIANVYQKGETYTFELIDWQDRKNRQKLRAVYEYDPN